METYSVGNAMQSLDPTSLFEGNKNLFNDQFDDEKRNPVEAIRLRLKVLVNNTLIGEFYNNMILLVSIFSTVHYIYQTYVEESTRQVRIKSEQWHFFRESELFFAFAFGFDWLLQLFIADHKILFITSLSSFIDLLTVIPIFVVYHQECPDVHHLESFRDFVIYAGCALNTVRILQTLRFGKRFSLIEDDVSRFVADMGLNIVVMILFNSALMKYFEPQQDLRFHTWTYYMIVTVATVGYGDITPESDLGRFAAMAMICFAIIQVPRMTNELIAKIGMKSKFARAKYIPKTTSSQHVLVCGDVHSASIIEFFEEMFHEDHEISNLHAVVLQQRLPNEEMLSLLRDNRFSALITYLEGSPLDDHDLMRARANQAKAVLILCNKFTSNPDEEDAKTILQQFSIHRHLRLYALNSSKPAMFCMQLIRPENKRHLVADHSDSNTLNDVVVCLNEIKMGVIAKAVIFPGANTLIMNLLTSFKDEKNLPVTSKTKAIEGIELLDEDGNSGDWMGEYQRGCDWEIYQTELCAEFVGKKFSELAFELYKHIGIVLLGLEVKEITKKGKITSQIVLNPADYIIPPKSPDLHVSAFVLAKNKAQSDLTFSKKTPNDALTNMMNWARLKNLNAGWTIIGGDKIMDGLTKNNSKIYIEEEKDEALNKEEEKFMWKKVLREHEASKSTQLIQEENQRNEARLLKEYYFIRNNSIELNDAIIRTSVTDELPNIDKHIIIIGKALSNLYDLIRPLRAKSLGILKHIIILYPYDFPQSVWQRISIFESVWIVRGSPLEEADIRRCGIFKARQLIILADCTVDDATSTGGAIAPGQLSGSAGLDALIDADAIFCYQAIKRLNDNAHVVVEIVRHNNVSYLDPESGLNSSDVDFKFTSQFAGGAMFATSLLDTLVGQAFYNTKIIEVINKLVGEAERMNDARDKQNKVQSTSKIHNQRKKIDVNRKNLRDSALYQIPIPRDSRDNETRSYEALFHLLARKKMIPLGLLRGTYKATKSGPNYNKMPYVYTNPPKETELFSCDRVFVLSQTPIRIVTTAKTKADDLDLHLNRTRKKTTEDVLNLIKDMREELNYSRLEQMRLQEQVDCLQQRIDQQHVDVLRAISALNANTVNNNNNNNTTSNSSNNSVVMNPISRNASCPSSPKPGVKKSHNNSNSDSKSNAITPTSFRRPYSATSSSRQNSDEIIPPPIFFSPPASGNRRNNSARKIYSSPSLNKSPDVTPRMRHRKSITGSGNRNNGSAKRNSGSTGDNKSVMTL